MREFLHHLAAALRELLHPAPFVDEDPQSTADATAVRTDWIRSHQPTNKAGEAI